MSTWIIIRVKVCGYPSLNDYRNLINLLSLANEYDVDWNLYGDLEVGVYDEDVPRILEILWDNMGHTHQLYNEIEWMSTEAYYPFPPSHDTEEYLASHNWDFTKTWEWMKDVSREGVRKMKEVEE